MKTKEKIVQASLELFNLHGERSITTNHIAAHIKISPGNLYYHYRNKSDIIARIFDQYEKAVAELFELPADRDITLEDRARLTDKLLDLIWEYRFMHRDLVGMLANDTELKERYKTFATQGIKSTEIVYRRMCESGFMAIPEDQIKPLALNIWILATSWTTYLRTALGVSEDKLTREQLNQVIYQMTYLEMPYLTEATKEETQQLLATYGPNAA
ncbi:TetR/AcrR family transcriptional regulator [Oceanospirillum sp. HFRX-1_2]